MSKQKLASNLILLMFIIFVGAAAYFSDIFKINSNKGSEALEQTRLFAANELILSNKITLKNKSGEYNFERDPNTPNLLWHMVSPKDISTNSLFIEKLFNSLTVIKIKKILPDEKSNAANFSLDKPTSTLTLSDQNSNLTTIQFGLMNSIDNSIYLKISGRPGIYHVEAPNVPLEDATLSDLIESQIFILNPKLIANLKIFHSNKKTESPSLLIEHNQDKWIDSNQVVLANEKIEDYLQNLTNLKSHFLIDKPNDSQKKLLLTSIRPIDFILEIEDSKKEITDYIIRGPFNEITDLDLKNEDHYLISISNNPTLYLIKKEFLDLFNKKNDFFKTIEVKKKN